MKKHNGGLMLAFDESIAIKHELKTIEQLIKEKKKPSASPSPHH